MATVYTDSCNFRYVTQEEYDKIHATIMQEAVKNDAYLADMREEFSDQEFECGYDELDSGDQDYINEELPSYVAMDIHYRLDAILTVITKQEEEITLKKLYD